MDPPANLSEDIGTDPSESERRTSTQNTSPIANDPNDQTTDSPCKSISVLLCSKCRMPVSSCENVHHGRALDSWAQQVYAYELEIFSDNSPTWCYSATNPSGRRFDLVRCSRNIATTDKLVSLEGNYSSEHSFFLGHAWCFCKCGSCGNFLGWGFHRLDAPLTDETVLHCEAVEPSFVGLILTHCVGRDDYRMDAYMQCLEGAERRKENTRNLENAESRLFAALNGMTDRIRASSLLRTFMMARSVASPRNREERLNDTVTRAEEAEGILHVEQRTQHVLEQLASSPIDGEEEPQQLLFLTDEEAQDAAGVERRIQLAQQSHQGNEQNWFDLALWGTEEEEEGEEETSESIAYLDMDGYEEEGW